MTDKRLMVVFGLCLIAGLLVGAASSADSLRPADPPPVAAPSAVLVEAAWGSGPGELGKSDEASRPGPMDFALAGDALYVLDPVNARVQVFGLDGRFRGSIDIDTRSADFLCVDAGGTVTVLDAFVRRELKQFAADGALLAQVRLPEAVSLCSAIFTDGEHIWIEERHDRVYELGIDRERLGRSAAIVTALPGRPGGLVHAHKRGGARIVLSYGEGRSTLDLQMPRAVRSIAALETDAAGRVYVAANCLPDAGRDAWKVDIVVVALDPDEGVVGTARLPSQYVTDHYRKLCVTPAGEIIQMQTSEEGVRFVRWTLQPASGGEVRR